MIRAALLRYIQRAYDSEATEIDSYEEESGSTCGCCDGNCWTDPQVNVIYCRADRVYGRQWHCSGTLQRLFAELEA